MNGLNKKVKLVCKDKKRLVLSCSILSIIIISIIISIIFNIKNKRVKYEEVSAHAENIEEVEIDTQESQNEVKEEQLENLPEETEESEDINNSQDIENLDNKSSKVDITSTSDSKSKNNAKYYIKINNTANVVTIYSKDDSGEYTVPCKAMVCSTGIATPKSGVYSMSGKYRWLALFGGVYGQYCSRITGHILFHSVPYFEKSPDTLEYEEYDKLGTSASAGCVRLKVEDAKWIYENCTSGTYVEFYSSQDVGPLGKPSAQKISSNETCRNWDPTDVTSGNPWITYKEETSNIEQKKEENINITEENNEKEAENELTEESKESEKESLSKPNTDELPSNQNNTGDDKKEQQETDNGNKDNEADEQKTEDTNNSNNKNEVNSSNEEQKQKDEQENKNQIKDD